MTLCFAKAIPLSPCHHGQLADSQLSMPVTWAGCCWSNVSCLAKSYNKNSNISRTLVRNKIVDHSDVVGALRCSNYIFILDFTSGFKGFGKDSRKTVWESFKCWDLVWLILETWRYIKQLCMRSFLKISQINTHTATIMQKTHFYSQERKKFWLLKMQSRLSHAVGPQCTLGHAHLRWGVESMHQFLYRLFQK